MNKKEESNTNNVIPFPNLKERLLQLGADALQDDDPQEAVRYLEQAFSYDSDDYRVLWALIAAYMEQKHWSKAKKICQDMLNKGIGSYYMVFETYVKTLIELRDFEEAEKHISALLEEQRDELNPNVHDRLENLLSLIEKRKSNKTNSTQEESDSIAKFDDSYWFQHLHLFQQDIRPYINDIQVMLNENDRHPFIKTVMLHALIEQHYDLPVSVTKFDKTRTIIPVKQEGFNQQSFYLKLVSILREQIESENPTLFSSLKQLVERNFFILFPFQMEPENEENTWACAYHLKGLELFSHSFSRDEVIKRYETTEEQVMKSIDYLEFLDTIPFPDA
ncbi:hypothetical protein GCM10008967_25600 [Bacillus carboniphilus]|uniref:Tetratricopeptide repeat protein n=1 Tax=Bacillus carboniphilus TaxID=86663 RepID=A0ABN0WDI2_9BACI